MNATLLAPANTLTSLSSSFRKEAATEEMTLVCGRAVNMDRHVGASRVRVLDGLLWITEEGDTTDYVVGAGEVFVPSRSGRVVVESLAAASRFVMVPEAA